MELEELCKSEIEKMESILKEVMVKDVRALEVYNLALSYFTDAKHFFDKKDFVRAFEAIVICWAYLDACLHFNFLEIPEEFKKHFTV
ncbi:MAG: DUF357 domain-containing protein [Candidatus Aenigmatarchaeota archaeon]